MATISPNNTRTEHYADRADVKTILWETVTEADEAAGYLVPSRLGLSGFVQFIGTFGSATLALEGSNDGTNWFVLKDVNGTAISCTAAAAFEFSTSALFIRPATSGGTSSDVDAIVVIRG